MGHIPIDKVFHVDVKVDYLRKKMFGLKINKREFRRGLDNSLTFTQYIPWENKTKFQQDIVNLINKWTLKRTYGSIQIREKTANLENNGCHYVFTVSMNSVDYFNLEVDVYFEWRKTWLGSMMIDCDEQITKLIKSLIFSVKEDYTYTGDYLNEMDQAITYVPGVEYQTEIKRYHVYLVVDEDGTKYIINLNNSTDERDSVIQIKTSYYVMRYSFEVWQEKRNKKNLNYSNIRIWEFDEKWQRILLDTLNKYYREDHS